jgi:two-component system, LytTR family, response regulator
MQVKAIIIDDEQNNIDNLSTLLQLHCPQVIIAATAITANDGIEQILLLTPDLVFLDIQMPHKNGFELLQSLQQYSFEVIFVTAYDQYGIQAIKFSALDYLLKPVNTLELIQAVNRATEKLSLKTKNRQIENLIMMLHHQQKRENHRIALATLKETRFVQTDEIIHCESINNYCVFFLSNGEKLTVSKPIYEYEEMLADYGFIRCHQSHLINKKFVKSLIKKDGGYLLLYDGTELPISRNKKDIIKSLFQKTT